ncbi:MAG TPA: hypothetical protein VGP93_05655 [Polyangiaceae bacterium]|nr:hypothetical protein [Polyangiaceae bacterium]
MIDRTRFAALFRPAIWEWGPIQAEFECLAAPPHPDFYRFVGYGEVELVGAPSNPAGGEPITAVECVSVDEAASRLRSCGQEDVSDLYLLAAELARTAP